MIDRDAALEACGHLDAISSSGDTAPRAEASHCDASVRSCSQTARGTNSYERPQSSDLMGSIQGYIGSELALVENAIESAVSSQYDVVRDLGRQASSMGGKRLRPIMVWLAAKAAGNEYAGNERADRSLRLTQNVRVSSQAAAGRGQAVARRTDLVAIAAAIEMVHAASLVHDDVMDSAIERRHLPTIAHQSGSSAAILLGDFLFTKAYGLAASCRGTTPARRIAAAATELCEGELRQQLSSSNWGLTLDEYRSILVQKTGSLCGVACRLGSWRGGGSLADQRALYRYGVMLGLAFQIFDDWLDYWGTDAVGKTLGTDLAQQKPTLPLLHLLSIAPQALREEILCRVSRQTETTFAWTREQLDRYDAGAYTLQVAQRCVNRAKSALQVLPNSPARNYLEAIADFSVHRAS